MTKEWSVHDARHTAPLHDVARLLVRDETIVKAFGREFSNASDRIRRMAKRGELKDGEWTLLHDTLHNDARTYRTFSEIGSFGDYPIEILGLGGVYFVRAPEFDWTGYFSDIEHADLFISSSWPNPRPED